MGLLAKECTELPPYADALRYYTGLPVWDAITAADFYVTAYRDAPRFGLQAGLIGWGSAAERLGCVGWICLDCRLLLLRATNLSESFGSVFTDLWFEDEVMMSRSSSDLDMGKQGEHGTTTSGFLWFSHPHLTFMVNQDQMMCVKHTWYCFSQVEFGL